MELKPGDLLRKKSLTRVVSIDANGALVESADGNTSTVDKWFIDNEYIEKNYEKVETEK